MSPTNTTADAEKAIAEIADLIERLRGVVEQETALVHAGKVRAAAALGATKSELAGQLFAGGERLKANAKFLLQSAPARLRRAHPPARDVSRRAAEEHDRAGDLARGIGGNRAPAFARPRAQRFAPSLRRLGPHAGAEPEAGPAARRQPRVVVVAAGAVISTAQSDGERARQVLGAAVRVDRPNRRTPSAGIARCRSCHVS